MDIKVAAVLVALFALGANVVVRVFDFTPKQKKIIGAVSIIMMVLSGGTLLYGLFVGFESNLVEVGDTETPNSVNQMNLNSPGAINALGDVNINQARRITKTDEFVRVLRAVGPVAVKLEYLEDRDASFLYGQLYHLLVASQWTADKRAKMDTTPWTGVYVAVRDIHVAPPAAVKLVEQLRANGIASRLVNERNSNAFEGTAFIVKIGYLPLDNNK